MENPIKNIALVTLFSFGLLPTAALADTGDIVFNRTSGGVATTNFGTKKAETYDVATLLTGSDLKGMTIKSLTIPFKSKNNITDLKVWLSKELKLEKVNGKKINVPDILSQDVTIDADTITVTFAEPYTITSDSIYLGYSFKAAKNEGTARTPVILSTTVTDGGFFVHSSSTYRSWMDYSAKGSAAISALLGGALADAIEVSTTKLDLIAQTGQNVDVNVEFENHGYNGVKSVDYEYTIDDTKAAQHLDLDTPVEPVYKASGTIALSIPVPNAKGGHKVSVKLTAVNGKANPTKAEMDGSLYAFTKMPKHRAVVEEYTGTWCGFCPRGLVGLEVMNKLYPDDFIGISYHNGDAMEIMSSASFPSDVSGFPAAFLDRKVETDAYYGNSNSGFGIDQIWKLMCDQFTPVVADATATLSKDKAKVSVNANLTFVKELETKGYNVEFVLVSDSLHGTGSSWTQSNYYANGAYGGAETFPEEEFEPFYNGASKVEGIYFPDVIIATSRLGGNNAALKDSYVEDEEAKLSYTFDLSAAVNTSGESLVQSTKNLRAVVLVCAADGTIVNAAKAAVKAEGDVTGISTVNTSATDTPSEVYNIAGQRLPNMQRGLNLVKMSNNKTVKVFLRK
mgnify:FL=1